MSALFNFHSFLSVVLLVICTCTFLKMQFPAFLDQKTGYSHSLQHFMDCQEKMHTGGVYFAIFRGFFWKAARIGERLSPWVAAGCLTMGVSTIFF